MTTKEYLNQAYRLDQRINSKLEQVSALNDLATKVTVTLSGMPKNPNRPTTVMSDAITKIIDLQDAINSDIDRLVDLKCEIVEVIGKVNNAESQALLVKRYLHFEDWGRIAKDLGFSKQHIYRIRDRAINELTAILQKSRLCDRK